MVFLYAGLGIAMISGISAMLLIGNNINNLMFLSTFKRDEYFETSLASKDRRIMEILNNYSGPKEDVCKKVKENLSDSLYEDGEIFLSSGNQTPSKNSLFNDSCVLVNKEIKHRVIISNNKSSGFNLFSCYLKNKPACDFEENK